MKRKKIIIIGGGQTADEIYPILKNLKYDENYIIHKILDDNKIFHKKNYKGIPIEVGISNARKYKDCQFVFGIGSYQNRNNREKILKKTELNKSFFPNIIHKNTVIENDVKLGCGNIIYPFSVLCSRVRIENFCVLTYSNIIAHNVKIGSFSLFGSRTSILNNTNIGKNVFCGASVLFAENLKIGDSSTIIFGSTIMCNIPRGKTVYGNPGEIINHG